MKVPPASAYRSRIANEAASPVLVPKCIVPRLSTLTSRRVFGSVPIVRYFTWVLSSRPVRPGRSARVSMLECALGQITLGKLARAPRGGPAGAAALVTFVVMFESAGVLDGLNEEQ